MQFRTTFQYPISDTKIGYQHKIFTIGSCFSDEIGNKLINSKFNTLINPFGTIFNTHSIQNLILRSINLNYYKEEEVHQNREQFFCFDVHSSFNSFSKEEVVSKLNSTLNKVHGFISTCDFLILTLGTSWVYRRLENNKIVANCHKFPGKEFDKILLKTEENFKVLNGIVSNLIAINPKIRIITTVSPVRHIKDGIVENNVSKARLIDALYQLKLTYKEVDYFPSYELIMDDLRDYRFFKEDMIHPTMQAVDYIWNKFSEIYFDESTKTNIYKIEKIKQALLHRPFNEKSKDHLFFLKKILSMIEALEKESKIDFGEEIRRIMKKIE